MVISSGSLLSTILSDEGLGRKNKITKPPFLTPFKVAKATKEVCHKP